MKNLLTTLVAVLISSAATAQAMLWQTDTARHSYFRIPAILAYNNHVVAFADNRSGVTDATSWGDIGSVGNISVEVRHSYDGGLTWNAPQTAAMGFGSGGFDQGHGDAAVVRDRETGRMLMMCASGSMGYGRSAVSTPGDYSAALRVGRYYSLDQGHTWNGGDVTDQIYSIYRGCGNIFRLFFTSGRICQSRLIKHGTYYRIYSAIVTNEGSVVVYSDDFGHTWNALGGAAARPAPEGDESKIEELPDGNVLLSCRRSGKDGRIFNVFTYADSNRQQGAWASPVVSSSPDGGTATIGNNCNGEILLVPAVSADGRRVYMALQSVPRGTPGNHPTNLERRSHVSIYWKVFGSAAECTTPDNWVCGWKRYQITDGYSAYSTMAIDGADICFIYEDRGVHFRLGSQSTEMYSIFFRRLSLSDITEGGYSAVR